MCCTRTGSRPRCRVSVFPRWRRQLAYYIFIAHTHLRGGGGYRAPRLHADMATTCNEAIDLIQGKALRFVPKPEAWRAYDIKLMAKLGKSLRLVLKEAMDTEDFEPTETTAAQGAE